MSYDLMVLQKLKSCPSAYIMDNRFLWRMRDYRKRTFTCKFCPNRLSNHVWSVDQCNRQKQNLLLQRQVLPGDSS